MKRKYESMFIIRTDLTEEDRENVLKKIQAKIEEKQGQVTLSKLWIKERDFYFPIRSRGAEKKKHFKGAYWLLQFELDTECLPDLKEMIRLEENILRNIILRRDEKKEKVKKAAVKQ